MKVERLLLLLAIAAIAYCAYEIQRLRARVEALSQLAAAKPAAAPTTTNLVDRVARLEALTPTPGLFMMAIQSHFAKLYYAAEARNWELAAFERGEVLENLETVIRLLPEQNGVSLTGIADAFKNTPMESLKDAIAVKDRGLFREAYQNCLIVCNACHQATGRPYLFITIPTNPPVSNQRWEIPVDSAR